MILKIAVPLLTLIYPESIALVLISFANMFSTFRFSWAYRLATVITLIISILQILNSFNLLHGVILKSFMMLPLADIDLAWLAIHALCYYRFHHRCIDTPSETSDNLINAHCLVMIDPSLLGFYMKFMTFQ